MPKFTRKAVERKKEIKKTCLCRDLNQTPQRETYERSNAPPSTKLLEGTGRSRGLMVIAEDYGVEGQGFKSRRRHVLFILSHSNIIPLTSCL